MKRLLNVILLKSISTDENSIYFQCSEYQFKKNYERDMLFSQLPKFVQTDPIAGITKQEAERAISILNAEWQAESRYSNQLMRFRKEVALTTST